MSDFQDMMRRARQDAQQGDWAPPPGTHFARVVEGDAFESRAGDVYAKTTLELTDPDSPDKGKRWDHLMGFRSPQQQAMSVGQLSVYGLSDDALDNLEDVDDLAGQMAELAGVEVEVSCTARKDGDGVWTSVNVSRRPGGNGLPADTDGLDFKPAPPPADDDDVPY